MAKKPKPSTDGPIVIPSYQLLKFLELAGVEGDDRWPEGRVVKALEAMAGEHTELEIRPKEA